MQKGVLGMCNLLGHSERRDGAGRRIFADVGGSAWRRVGVLGSRACYKAYKQAQSIEATVLVLTGVGFGS